MLELKILISVSFYNTGGNKSFKKIKKRLAIVNIKCYYRRAVVIKGAAKE